MKPHKGLLVLFLLYFQLSVFNLQLKSQTYTIHSVPYDNLKNKYDFVSNPDEIISQSAEEQINRMITVIEDSASAEIAVVLLKSIGNTDIDAFGTELFTHWGIGKKQKDNGLLFLLVEDQRQMIFRTGYGLEGALPDVVLSGIIRNDISPFMAQGNADQAIITGIDKVGRYLLNPEIVREILVQKQQEQDRQHEETIAFFKNFLIIYLILSLIVFLYYIFSFSSKLKIEKNNPDKYNLLNAARSSVIICTVLFPLLMIFFIPVYFIKLRNIRNNPVICPRCNCKMIKQSEINEDAYLNPVQTEEEKIKSVDYDVWHCTHCGHNEIFAYDNMHTKYAVCPYCQAKTYFLENNRIVKNATTFSKGRGEKIYKCLHCQKKDIIPYLIPMILISSGMGGRKNGGFGGGSTGGGFSGGFGGGRTGGGGARGGW